MRMGLRCAALLATMGALTAGTVTPAAAAPPNPDRSDASWSADLDTGDPAGVLVEAGVAVLDLPRTFLAPLDDGAPPRDDAQTERTPTDRMRPVGGVDTEATARMPTGLLTLPTKRLAAPTDRVTAVASGDLPSGTTAVVDVRGRRTTGGWTEWIPARPAAALPEPSTEVQGRLVLTGTSATSPTVRDITLTAHPLTPARQAEARADSTTTATQAPLTYRVFATREGLVGGTTANGHVISERDHFVALPSRRALSPRGTSDYSVRICAPNGRCAFAPVWDVGPWNTRDDYWNPGAQRQQWSDLPQGLPQAQAAYADGHNRGQDQYDRDVANPAGIDLGDGVFWDALGLTTNAFVTVDYLWTGDIRLSGVATDEPVDLLAAPDPAADVVGIVAERAGVPIECVLTSATGRFLRLGTDQYVTADAVPNPGSVGPC